MSKILYVIIDGMSESVLESSLAQANTPTFDLIAGTGRAGFYIPFISPSHVEPKTDVVVPAFVGLPVNLNPGRAALELVDHGVTLVPGAYCCTLKLFVTPLAINLDWRNSQPVDEVIQQEVIRRVNTIAHSYGVMVQRSEATQYGERMLLGNCSEIERDNVVNEVHADLQSRGLQLHVESSQKIPDGLSLVYGSRSDVVFLGWAKGSLRGAFKYLGARCNPFTRPTGLYYNWKIYERDFEDWCEPVLENNMDDFGVFVLYTKQAAFASRQNDRKHKIETIEWMDKVTLRTLQYLEPGSRVIILSDHSADLGGYTNPVKHTCYAISKWDGRASTGERSDATRHFCEKLIFESRGSEPISQEVLMRYIDSL